MPETGTISIGVGGKVRAYFALLKARLSFLVAFSSGFGYILGHQGPFVWFDFIMLCLGGFLVSGSAVTINQIIEREYDKIMSRTMARPLPTGALSIQEASVYAVLVGAAGLLLLFFFTNLMTTSLAFLSLLLYSFAYTPLKRVGPIAVFVGAIPGALPPLLGWTAATNMVGQEALILFFIQFIWQFPHFWAIAWVADEDYTKAGFRLLPNNGHKDTRTAFNIMIYALFLIPLGLLPMMAGITGMTSAIVAVVCGVLFLAQTFSLMRDASRKSALRIMFGSFIYLPVVQIAFMLDKLG